MDLEAAKDSAGRRSSQKLALCRYRFGVVLKMRMSLEILNAYSFWACERAYVEENRLKRCIKYTWCEQRDSKALGGLMHTMTAFSPFP